VLNRTVLDQLQAIYMGKITNWSQVNGPNLPIVPIANESKDSRVLQMLMGSLPGGVSNAKGIRRIFRDYTASIRATSNIPGAIGYASLSTVFRQGTVNPVAIAKSHSTQYISPYISRDKINISAIQTGDYCLIHNVFVDIREDGTLNEKAGKAYANLLLSLEGQKLVEQAGFIPVRQLNF